MSDLNLHSLICAPLIDTTGDVLGVIQLDVFDEKIAFTKEDLDLLAGVARQLAIYVQNARLHELALRNQRLKLDVDRFEYDLSVAREVQRGQLPKLAPAIAGYEFFHIYEPAEQVGGDFFDYIRLAEDRLAILVADVSGEGIPAALVMARFAADARHCLTTQPTLLEAITRLNQILCETSQDRYITLVLTVLGLQTHEATIINAGHWPPLLRRRHGAIEDVEPPETAFPLGMFDDARYSQRTIPLETGESLTMFTDGINEAKNAQQQMYGVERIRKQLAGNDGSAEALGGALFSSVKEFTGDHMQTDDMCLLCLRRTGD